MRDIVIRKYTDRGSGDPMEKRTYTRDYWLKLYAGRALGGLCANPNITAYSDLSDRESPDNEDIIEFAKFSAQKLVDEMFKDGS